MLTISIVLTTFNGERFLVEQLDSIRLQTLKPYEVLIFDDKSTDNTVSIIRDYILRFNLDNWILIVNEKQLGWRSNFFCGFLNASGDIVFPCDQDDIWRYNKIEKMTSIFEEYPQINVLASNYMPFFVDGSEEFKRNYLDDYSVEKINLNRKNIYNQRPGCSMAFRKSFLETYCGMWNSDLAHDEFLWKTALLLNSLYIYNSITLDYRRHNNNATKRMHSISNRIKENKGCMLYFGALINSSYFNNDSFIHRQFEFYKKRNDLFENRNLRNLLALLKYVDLYKTKKNFLGDLAYYFCPKIFKE